MFAARLRRSAATLGAVGAAAALVVTGTPQLASADGTRTIVGSTTCASGIVPYGFYVDYGSGWTPYGGTSVWPAGTQTKIWTWVIPSTATSFALDTFCYANSTEYNGQVSYPYGTWEGYTYSLTPGTSTINSTWRCDRYPVYPGPWIRTCSMTSISYG
ncbi:MAG TPA: hypothetical protein VF069_16325 [Streptosporangiaceae bacterium]